MNNYNALITNHVDDINTIFIHTAGCYGIPVSMYSREKEGRIPFLGI
jgi:hypothetical protein